MPLTMYQQAFALMQSTWRAIEHRPAATQADLGSIIKQNIKPAFTSYDGELSPQQAWHLWDDYDAGPLDTYVFGPTDGIQQLLPPELFERLCSMLSSTNDTRIPLQPFRPASDFEGLWYYGFYGFTHAPADKVPRLSDQICQRGIGPHGELILRSRPMGTIKISTVAGANITARRAKAWKDAGGLERPTREQLLEEAGAAFLSVRDPEDLNELSAWEKQCVKNTLRQLLKNQALGCDARNDTDIDRRPRLRLALDFAITLPFACACEIAKNNDDVRGSALMLQHLLDAHVLVDRKPVYLFSRDERTSLTYNCPWPQTPLGMAAVVTCAIARCLLGEAPSIYGALLDHFGLGAHGPYLAQGDPYINIIASWGSALAIRATDERFTYNDMYVPPAFETAPGTKAAANVRTAADANPACFVAQAALDGSARLLVQAGSGMGKTTYLRGLAAGIALKYTENDATLFNIIAQSDHAASLLECMPVCIAQPDARSAGRGFELLADARTLPTSDEFAALLYQQLPLEYKRPFLAAAHDHDQAAEQLFCERLKADNALVIVDSIDEVPIAVRSAYLTCLSRLVGDYRIRRLIVTSRPLSDADEDKLEQLVHGNVVRLLAFDHDRQLDLFCRLSAGYGTEQAPTGDDTADAVSSLHDRFERIATTPGFAEILGNPLMLTALTRALAHEPEPRAFNTLDAIVSMLPKLPDQDTYDDQVLSHIAYDLTYKGIGSDMDERQFCQAYRTYWWDARGIEPPRDATAEPDRERIIDRMITRRGVLTMNHGRIGFAYVIVQALFACRFILDTLAAGVTDTLTEEQFDQARSLYRRLLSAAANETEQADHTAELTALLFLSAWNPHAAWLYEDLQTSLYGDLCSIFLFSMDDDHDLAARLLRASRTFDFGAPCPRTEKVRTWESRLVMPSSQHAPQPAANDEHKRHA